MAASRLSLTLSLLVARLVAVCVISRSLCVCRVSCVDMAMEEKLLEQDVLVEASKQLWTPRSLRKGVLLLTTLNQL